VHRACGHAAMVTRPRQSVAMEVACGVSRAVMSSPPWRPGCSSVVCTRRNDRRRQRAAATGSGSSACSRARDRERREEADEWAHLNLKFKRNRILQ
jgi:hypothetical protein